MAGWLLLGLKEAIWWISCLKLSASIVTGSGPALDQNCIGGSVLGLVLKAPSHFYLPYTATHILSSHSGKNSKARLILKAKRLSAIYTTTPYLLVTGFPFSTSIEVARHNGGFGGFICSELGRSPAPKYRPHLVLKFQAYTEEAVIETCLCIGYISDLFYDRCLDSLRYLLTDFFLSSFNLYIINRFPLCYLITYTLFARLNHHHWWLLAQNQASSSCCSCWARL